MANKETETEDIELKEYNFKPEEITVNGIKVLDYTKIEHDKVYLCNKKDILTKARPDWIPELDDKALFRDQYLPVCVKDNDGNFFVLRKLYKGIEKAPGRFGSTVDKPVFENEVLKMSLDVMTATIDYYIKKKRAELKEAGSKEHVSLPRTPNTMLLERYNNMVYLLSFCKSYSEDKDILEDYSYLGRRRTWIPEGYTKQKKVIFNEQWQPLLQAVKDKKLDMNLQKQDLIDTYAKGEETSYGKSGRSDSLLDEYGVMIKKQNGTSFNSEQKEKLVFALDSVWKYFGSPEELAKSEDLTLSYADNCNQHARKASGIFRHSGINNELAIGVSFYTDEKKEDYRADATLAHEVTHWLDYERGKETHHFFASDIDGSLENKIASEFKRRIRNNEKAHNEKARYNSKIKVSNLGEYWFRTCECLARAVEEHYALKMGYKNYYTESLAYLPEEEFIENIEPLVNELIEDNQKHFNLITEKTVETKEESKVSENHTIEDFSDKYTDSASLLKAIKECGYNVEVNLNNIPVPFVRINSDTAGTWEVRYFKDKGFGTTSVINGDVNFLKNLKALLRLFEKEGKIPERKKYLLQIIDKNAKFEYTQGDSIEDLKEIAINNAKKVIKDNEYIDATINGFAVERNFTLPHKELFSIKYEPKNHSVEVYEEGVGLKHFGNGKEWLDTFVYSGDLFSGNISSISEYKTDYTDSDFNITKEEYLDESENVMRFKDAISFSAEITEELAKTFGIDTGFVVNGWVNNNSSFVDIPYNIQKVFENNNFEQFKVYLNTLIDKERKTYSEHISKNIKTLQVYQVSTKPVLKAVIEKLTKEGFSKESFNNLEDLLFKGDGRKSWIIPVTNESNNHLVSWFDRSEYLEAHKSEKIEYLNENLEMEIENKYSGLKAKSYYNSKDTRNLCHVIKSADNSPEYKEACQKIADYFISQNVFDENSILIPAPQHTGNAEYTGTIASLISAKTGASVADILHCKPHKTLYEQKKEGSEPDVEFFLQNATNTTDDLFEVSTIEFWKNEGRKLYLIDNNISTGFTFNKASKLIPGLIPAPYAIGNFAEIEFSDGKYYVKNLIEEFQEINTVTKTEHEQGVIEKPYTVFDAAGEHKVFKLWGETELSRFLYNPENPDAVTSPENIKLFNKWLKEHKEDYVRLYHGTSSVNRESIQKVGIQKTNNTNRKSYQSEPGFVYLSRFPDSARTFGELNNYAETDVYAVDLQIQRLKADIDQLKNKRLWGGIKTGTSLAESLLIGNGARCPLPIKPYELSRISFEGVNNMEKSKLKDAYKDKTELQSDLFDVNKRSENTIKEKNVMEESKEVDKKYTELIKDVSSEFDRLYNSEDYTETREACQAFDSLMKDEEFAKLVKEIVDERGDFFSSDRECAAAYIAMRNRGMLKKWEVQKEEPSKTTEKPYSFFVKDDVEFEEYADFGPFTGLTAEAALSKYLEYANSAIGVSIPTNKILNFENGEGNAVMGRLSDGEHYIDNTFLLDYQKTTRNDPNFIAALNELVAEAKFNDLDVKVPGELIAINAMNFAKNMEKVSIDDVIETARKLGYYFEFTDDNNGNTVDIYEEQNNELVGSFRADEGFGYVDGAEIPSDKFDTVVKLAAKFYDLIEQDLPEHKTALDEVLEENQPEQLKHKIEFIEHRMLNVETRYFSRMPDDPARKESSAVYHVLEKLYSRISDKDYKVIIKTFNNFEIKEFIPDWNETENHYQYLSRTVKDYDSLNREEKAKIESELFDSLDKAILSFCKENEIVSKFNAIYEPKKNELEAMSNHQLALAAREDFQNNKHLSKDIMDILKSRCEKEQVENNRYHLNYISNISLQLCTATSEQLERIKKNASKFETEIISDAVSGFNCSFDSINLALAKHNLSHEAIDSLRNKDYENKVYNLVDKEIFKRKMLAGMLGGLQKDDCESLLKKTLAFGNSIFVTDNNKNIYRIEKKRSAFTIYLKNNFEEKKITSYKGLKEAFNENKIIDFFEKNNLNVLSYETEEQRNERLFYEGLRKDVKDYFKKINDNSKALPSIKNINFETVTNILAGRNMNGFDSVTDITEILGVDPDVFAEVSNYVHKLYEDNDIRFNENSYMNRLYDGAFSKNSWNKVIPHIVSLDVRKENEYAERYDKLRTFKYEGAEYQIIDKLYSKDGFKNHIAFVGKSPDDKYYACNFNTVTVNETEKTECEIKVCDSFDEALDKVCIENQPLFQKVFDYCDGNLVEVKKFLTDYHYNETENWIDSVLRDRITDFLQGNEGLYRTEEGFLNKLKAEREEYSKNAVFFKDNLNEDSKEKFFKLCKDNNISLPVVVYEGNEGYGSNYPKLIPGKIYTLGEFENVMEEYDPEGQKTYGYNKSWFTLVSEDGSIVSERYDIGDGNGGLIGRCRNEITYYKDVLNKGSDIDSVEIKATISSLEEYLVVLTKEKDKWLSDLVKVYSDIPEQSYPENVYIVTRKEPGVPEHDAWLFFSEKNAIEDAEHQSQTLKKEWEKYNRTHSEYDEPDLSVDTEYNVVECSVKNERVKKLISSKNYFQNPANERAVSIIMSYFSGLETEERVRNAEYAPAEEGWMQIGLRIDELKALDKSSRPSTSEWGKVQSCHKLIPGVYDVSTSGHGGILIHQSVADKIFTPKELEYLNNYYENGFISLEEDCDCNMALVVLYRNHLFEGFEWNRGKQAEMYRYAQESVVKHNPGFWDILCEERKSAGLTMEKNVSEEYGKKEKFNFYLKRRETYDGEDDRMLDKALDAETAANLLPNYNAEEQSHPWGVSLSIENDPVFGMLIGGSTILSYDDEKKKYCFERMYIDRLSEATEENRIIIGAYKSLQKYLQDAGVEIEEADYISEKEKILFDSCLDKDVESMQVNGGAGEASISALAEVQDNVADEPDESENLDFIKKYFPDAENSRAYNMLLDINAFRDGIGDVLRAGHGVEDFKSAFKIEMESDEQILKYGESLEKILLQAAVAAKNKEPYAHLLKNWSELFSASSLSLDSKNTRDMLVSDPETCFIRLYDATTMLSNYISERIPRNQNDFEITGFNPHTKNVISSYIKNPDTGKGLRISMSSEGVFANELGDPRYRLSLDASEKNLSAVNDYLSGKIPSIVSEVPEVAKHLEANLEKKPDINDALAILKSVKENNGINASPVLDRIIRQLSNMQSGKERGNDNGTSLSSYPRREFPRRAVRRFDRNVGLQKPESSFIEITGFDSADNEYAKLIGSRYSFSDFEKLIESSDSAAKNSYKTVSMNFTVHLSGNKPGVFRYDIGGPVSGGIRNLLSMQKNVLEENINLSSNEDEKRELSLKKSYVEDILKEFEKTRTVSAEKNVRHGKAVSLKLSLDKETFVVATEKDFSQDYNLRKILRSSGLRFNTLSKTFEGRFLDENINKIKKLLTDAGYDFNDFTKEKENDIEKPNFNSFVNDSVNLFDNIRKIGEKYPYYKNNLTKIFAELVSHATKEEAEKMKGLVIEFDSKEKLNTYLINACYRGIPKQDIKSVNEEGFTRN